MSNKQEPRIAVLGLGHVGLPTALTFSQLGWDVIGADNDGNKIERIAAGTPPFYEPGLQVILKEQLASGRLTITANTELAVSNSDIVFVCVGTSQNEDGSVDLSVVDNVAHLIGENIRGYTLIVEKSTVPAGTAARTIEIIAGLVDDTNEFDVAVNPEFLREGTAMKDCLEPDRIVIGVRNEKARRQLEKIYEPLVRGKGSGGGSNTDRDGEMAEGGIPLLVTDLHTAELIKHASNAFLATKISFINMVADVCESTGGDVTVVARGMGLDPRIGPHFLQAGAGYGGYCLPKDVKGFIWQGLENRVDMGLLAAVASVNEARITRIVEKLRQALTHLSDRTVAVWGLSFKPGTDDVREAPSLNLVTQLLAEGASLRVYDPEAVDEFRRTIRVTGRGIVYCESPMEAAEGADAVVVLTEWPEFQSVDLDSLRSNMRGPTVIDARNTLDVPKVREAGFEYHGFGR